MQRRKVVVYKQELAKGATKYERVADSNGIFLQFGINYEEFDSGPGQFTTAVVEMPDGSIRNLPVELVVFNN